MNLNKNNENMSTSNVQNNFVRITRSRAKALGLSIRPTKPSFKQHKRRPVLKDVTNTESIYSGCLEGGNIKARRKFPKETKKTARQGDIIAMEILVHMDTEKSKLAEDLSKIRMDEPGYASVSNSKDEDITELQEDGFGVMDLIQIVDIDSNVKDPQCCSFYVAEIYDNIHVAELEQRPSTNYTERVQRDIEPAMRRILIDWLVEISEEYKLVPDTLYLTVNLVDRFLSNSYIERQRLQLLGVTCMLIASKYEECYAPRVEDFCFITANTYTRLEVLSMEIEVLNSLRFQLSVPTTKTFLRRFIKAAQASYEAPVAELELLANFLAELTLVEYTFLRFLPSLIAASAVFLARWTLNHTVHPWNPTLQHYTRYEVDELKSTVLALEDLQLNTSGCNHNAISQKYSQDKFMGVARLTSPKRVTSFFSR